MGLLRNGISLLHFDETYFWQKGLGRQTHENIDLRNMRHVNLYCEEDSLRAIAKRLQNRKKKGITFIGSGNYHYITYLLLKEISTPFTLILFDNHPDLGMEQDQELLSCGSWVSYALKEIPLLQKVVIIGSTNLTAYSKHPRVVFFPFKGKHHYSINLILSIIQTKNIYISIDKDVLNTSEAVTNWDQGCMKLDELSFYLEWLLNAKQVEGIDVCGEAHVSPVDAFLPEYQTMVQRNETANLTILRTCLKTKQQQIKGA
ncbi:arginase family protein [Neobacillus dielmonensis]|uniref:arginase family protein n=1 Tax=Neobacillus dielmonensis TaxID=1347369 RepID=UPI0005A8A928|nr:arginase family protein [Neobacillus dielmonensis]